MQTRLCNLIGIEYPIIQAAVAPFTSAELVAAVSNAGGLGSFATALRTVEGVSQARQVAARGVDIIIGQGSEAGGFTGTVGALALIPQVVDAVHPVPVVAAGGIADGRGLAAALVLGAQGANIGTRFLASVEASCSDDWKWAILMAESEDTVRADVWWDIFPRPGDPTYDTAPRALRTSFIERWQRDRGGALRQAVRLQGEILQSAKQGRLLEFVPFTGQTAGSIHEILPAAEIVQRVVTEADVVLHRAATVSA
jgi:enoyl-[acyl-carrier protein] reductase II